MSSSGGGGPMNSGGAPRKRKRSEKGPGSKRRDQESSYIEELAELITASLSNPESLNMKPDKCAQLQETINQFKRIKQQQEAEHGSEVQHSHVSSSKPGMLAPDSLGNVLLETLDGFLFVVNNQGEIEFVTENVQTYINFKKEELVGSSVYNFIHVGDHKSFLNCLMPAASAGMWPPDPNAQSSRNRSFNCRMLVKIGQEDSLQEQIYENMNCSAILKPAPEKDNESSSSSKGDVPSHLFCIARRASMEEKSAMMSSSAPNTAADLEQFTTQLDLNAQILMVDFSHVKPPYYTKEEMVGQMIYKFCHSNDRQQLQQHFEEAKEKGSSSSLLYRFKIYNNLVVCVITNTRVCRNPHTGKPEFMVAEHSVIQREDGSHSSHASTSGASNNTSNSSSSAGASTSASSRLKQSVNNTGSANHKGNIFQALFPDGKPTNPKALKSSLGQIDLPTLQSIIRKQKLQQQQKQQGMHMNNLESLKKPSLSNILQQGGGSYSGGGGPDTGGMSYPATYGNNDKDGPVEKMPRLDRLSPQQNVASTTLQGSSSSMDAGDDGDVFLPNKSQDSGTFRSQDGGNCSKSGMDGVSFRNNSSSNPSPDTNEDDKDLAKNTLLQKLLLEEIDATHTLGKKRTNNNSPTSSTTSKPENGSNNKASPLCKDNQQKHDKKPYAQGSKETMGQGNRQGHQSRSLPDQNGDANERLLGKLLDGVFCFGSGKLPSEQTGFVSSTVVSTTTVLRTKSESDAEKEREQSNRLKRKNVLLQQLLMEDDDSASSPTDSSSFLKSDDMQSNDNTTSPTVSTTKPKLTSKSGAGSQRGAGNDGFMEDDSNGIVQQLLQAANDMSDDINQPNMIADFLKELEQSHTPTDTALMQNILGEEGNGNTSNDNNAQYGNNSNQRDNNMSSGAMVSNTNTMTTTSSHMPMSRQNSRGRADNANGSGGNQRHTPASSAPNSQYGSSPIESLSKFGQSQPSDGHPMAQMQQMAPPNQTAPSQGPIPHLPPFPSPSPNNPIEEQHLMQQLEQVLTSDNNLLSEIDDALGLNLYPDGTPMATPPTSSSSGGGGGSGGGGSGMLHSMLNNSSSIPMSSQSMPHMTSSPMPQGGMGGFPGGGGPGGSMEMQGQHQGGGGSMMAMMGPQEMGDGVPMMRPGYRPQQQQMPYMNPMQQQHQRMYNPMQSGMPGQTPGGQGFPPGGPGNMMQPPQQGGAFNQMNIRQTPQYQLRHTLLMRRRHQELKQQHMMQQQQQQQQEQQRQWQLQQRQQRQQQLMRSQSVGAMPGGQPPQQMAAAVAAAASQQSQQRMMHQQQHKNLMMLQQQQQQQTFSGQQVESQIMNTVDPQAFQEKLSDILNPSQGGAAPNVTIQKQPYGMGPGNRPMPGGQMMGPGIGPGPRGPPPPGMPPGQYPQNPNMPGQFPNQMMPQSRPNFQGGMPQGGGMGPNSMQYQDFAGNMGSNPMSGGGGNMMQGGMMGPNMGPHPNMMAGPNMPTNSAMGRNPGGINPNIPRPNLMASQSNMTGQHGPGHAPTPGHLSRSMSMPVGSGMAPGNSMSPNQYPMQGNPGGGQFTNLQNARGGGTPNRMMNRMPNNSNMQQNTSMGISNPMGTNTSMSQASSMGNQWGSGNAVSTAGQTSQQGQMYPTPVTTQAPSMGPDMFSGGNGGMNRGNADFQGMIGQQQRGGGNHNVTNQASLPPSSNGNMPNNPNIPTPTNIPTPVNMPPVSSSSRSSPGMFPNTPGRGAGGGGGVGAAGGSSNPNGPSELDMLGLTMELLDPNMTGSPNQAASSTTNPTSQPDSTSTGQADQYKSIVESSSREEAKRRFQDFCNISGAREAPDATTRATNLFRNQLLGSPKDGPAGASTPNMPHGSQQQPGQQQQGQYKQQTKPSSSQGQYPGQQNDQQNPDNQDPDAKSNSLLQKLLLE